MPLQRIKHFVSALALLVLAVSAAPPDIGVAAAPPPPNHDETHPLVMQQVAGEISVAPHPGLHPFSARSNSLAAQGSSTLTHEVFGFALASSLSDPTVGYPSWNFSLLSTVAFFGLHINDDGTITADSGWDVWNSSQLSDLLTVAHAHRTKVVVTIILQDFAPGTPHMCAGLANRATTVTKTVAEVSAKAVDGVNIDYEGLNGTCPNGQTARAMMTDFAHQLRTALPAALYLSVDTYASSATDPLGFFDVAGLNAYVDSFFVMAYDLEYSNYSRAPTSCTSFCLGPTSPLAGYYYNDTATASQYSGTVPASKVILGVPYYGRKSCVSSTNPNQYPTGTVTADTYLNASTETTSPDVQPGSYATHRDANDPTGTERWDTWFNTALNCTRELYWDDTTSLGLKYDLVNQAGLRGVGIWNLNYGGGASEVWASLSSHFAGCTGAGLTASPGPPQTIGSQVVLAATSSGCDNPRYEFWIQYPSGAWAFKQPFGPSATWNWDTTGYPAGPYTIHVWANQAGTDMSAFQGLGSASYQLSVPGHCASAALSPANPSAGAGSIVVLTASSSLCPKPLYEFWVGYPDGSWAMKQPFGSSATFNWDTTGLVPGTYSVHVWANQQGDSTATWEANGSDTVTLTGCTSAALASPAVTQVAGSTVNLTASSSGCSSPLYEFWVGYPDGSWVMKKAFSGSAAFSWDTTGMAAGSYSVHVWANNAGASTATWQANGAAAVTLTSGACTSASLSPSNPSAPAGSVVALTASSLGCVNPRYEFWVGYPNGSWVMKQPFGAGTAFNWDTTGLVPGTYAVHVWANNNGDSTATWEANGSDTITLTGCTSVTLSPATGSSSVGTPVTFTPAPVGCTNPQYEFWLQDTSGNWHMEQAFGVGTTWQWNTTGWAKGPYNIHVWANNQGADTSTWEANGSATYTLT